MLLYKGCSLLVCVVWNGMVWNGMEKRKRMYDIIWYRTFVFDSYFPFISLCGITSNIVVGRQPVIQRRNIVRDARMTLFFNTRNVS